MPGQNGSREQRLAALGAEGKKLIAAGSVLVVGGGLIGIETAGDLMAFAHCEAQSCVLCQSRIGRLSQTVAVMLHSLS